MKKIVTIAIIGLIMAACNLSSTEQKLEKARLDSIAMIDSISKLSGTPESRMFKRLISDTTGMSLNPIIIEKATIVRNTDLSGGVYIDLTFRNKADKDIQAIQFEFYCEDSFFEPAYMGPFAMSAGYNIHSYEKIVKANQSVTDKIYIDSNDPKTVFAIRADKVAFTDRTKFEL